MPRFFFNVLDGRSLVDTEGTDLPDVVAAQTLAVRHAGEVLRDDAARIGPSESWRMEVTDAAGYLVLSLDFGVTPSPARPHTPSDCREPPAGQRRE